MARDLGRLARLSQEERQALSAKANATRAAKASALRSDFPTEDEAEWVELAKAASVKLPPYGVPCTTGRMAKWLARLDIPLAAYLLWNGAGMDGNLTSAKLSDFIKRNPAWPLKAWLGLCLENRELMLDLYAQEATP